ncbi:hypothetical protein VZT92_021535 [Zoarces viviparus]|uniref:Uncharacterized protein n=1 Tax=Zoarces viviparus TaxID=48416 RepID=A0AAW1EBL4_ZOAVI
MSVSPRRTTAWLPLEGGSHSRFRNAASDLRTRDAGSAERQKSTGSRARSCGPDGRPTPAPAKGPAKEGKRKRRRRERRARQGPPHRTGHPEVCT